MRRTLGLFLTAALVPTIAAAQPAAPPSQGPMTVERVHSGWLAAPDFKVTGVDGKTSALAGGYAGWLSEGTLFVGGAGYWLANQASDRRLAYGGFMAQWLTRSDERVGFAVKGLIGGGQATLGATLSPMIRPGDMIGFPFDRLDRPTMDQIARALTPVHVRYREDFFIAEPEADILIRLTHSLRLTGGVGYRLVAAQGRDDNRLRGATGSIGLQIGGGY